MRRVKNMVRTSRNISILLRRFRDHQTGAIAPLFALMLVPILFAMMLAIDTANLMRVRGNVQNSLDAAALAVGKRFSNGSSENEMRAYGKNIFSSNLNAIEVQQTNFTLVFPEKQSLNKQILASAEFPYISYFGKAVKKLTGDTVDWDTYRYQMSATVRLKSTLEVALVLDNSGSMSQYGSGSREQRIVLLRKAATDLVNKLATQAKQITYVNNPVQFSLVPFDAAVNVGPENASASWMDHSGVSPIHYENFTMPALNKSLTLTSTKKITNRNGTYYNEGSGWGSEQNQIFTRFTLYNDLGKISKRSQAQWAGCIEARSGIYGINADPANPASPETMYVPMFAPDEDSRGNNNWWSDGSEGTTALRQSDLKKYYATSKTDSISSSRSPNYSCKTVPIVPLTNVTEDAGLKKIQDKIKLMQPQGNTNVPEGMVWGWRTLTSTAPFPHGRESSDHGNDKVIIVLTDGANVYNSSYASLGYPSVITEGYSEPRIYQEPNTLNSRWDSYTTALNARFKKLCGLAKADNIIIMAVALDLDAKNGSGDTEQIAIMKECSSYSRVRKDDKNPSQPAKLFWNSKGKDLEQTFKEIADELSNLRVVQ
ncbi:Tad domain-containing protein [Pseudochrobactrum sp. sp1633]|uniref:TadE/TadG family type IV pilus assembly protein n=1 Tax=Pseudochrobactrum sp. sp1633 TaxID=3036706 RepID=UPI0025A5B6D4|nr:Tad domain-containing protein [Pseudochrobactrum sp. sp1633]MDM8345375.1 Tad domain-containing protein [Pseudochrobactrum sp. sp1633]